MSLRYGVVGCDEIDIEREDESEGRRSDESDFSPNP